VGHRNGLATSQVRGHNLSLQQNQRDALFIQLIKNLSLLPGIERSLGRPDGGLVTLSPYSFHIQNVPEHDRCKYVPVDAFFQCDKPAVLRRRIKETFCRMGLQHELLCSNECRLSIRDSRGADT
jgi:hypothetical protein